MQGQGQRGDNGRKRIDEQEIINIFLQDLGKLQCF